SDADRPEAGAPIADLRGRLTSVRRAGLVGGRIALDELGVLLADPGGHLVVDERQEGVAAAPRHRRYRMQERAGEDQCRADRRLEAPGAEFGEGELAAVEGVVQIDRHGEAAVRRALGRVVAVRPEMPALLLRIAADKVALHARAVDAIDLGD